LSCCFFENIVIRKKKHSFCFLFEKAYYICLKFLKNYCLIKLKISMRKILLTVAGSLAALTMFGQASSAFLSAWSAKHNSTNQYKKAVLDFSDSTLYNEWNANQLINLGSPQQGQYTVDYSKTEKALHIHYKFIGTAGNDNYSDAVIFGYGYKQVNDSATPNTAVFNPFLEKDSIIGSYIDMTDSTTRELKLTMKVANLASTDSATVRCDIFDVNSRETNYDNSGAKTAIMPATTYQKIDYVWNYDSGSDAGNLSNWNESGLTFMDGYSGAWWGLTNGHWASGVGTTGLPPVTVTTGFQVPLDPAFVLPRFLIQFNSGPKTASWVQNMASGKLDGEMDFYISKAEFGTMLATGADVYYYPEITSVAVTAAGSATTISSDKGTLQLTATVLPANITDKSVTWSVSDLTLASIDSTGLLKALKNGTVTVTATTTRGAKIATYQVVLSNQIIDFNKIEFNHSITQTGDIFKFEGSAKLINLLGQVISTGVNTLDASNVTPGIYFIVLNGHAKQVFVK
jgi:uncharacterized protein YjdB